MALPKLGKPVDIVTLVKLESEFAKNPASTVFLDLTRAYLGNNRLMEAMVVCKKGLKNFPNNIEALELMASVYAEQNKSQKLEEILKILSTQQPENQVLREFAKHFQFKHLLNESNITPTPVYPPVETVSREFASIEKLPAKKVENQLPQFSSGESKPKTNTEIRKVIYTPPATKIQTPALTSVPVNTISAEEGDVTKVFFYNPSNTDKNKRFSELDPQEPNELRDQHSRNTKEMPLSLLQKQTQPDFTISTSASQQPSSQEDISEPTQAVALTQDQQKRLQNEFVEPPINHASQMQGHQLHSQSHTLGGNGSYQQNQWNQPKQSNQNNLPSQFEENSSYFTAARSQSYQNETERSVIVQSQVLNADVTAVKLMQRKADPKKIFFAILSLFAGLIIWAVYINGERKNTEKINTFIQVAKKTISFDTSAGYKESINQFQSILKIDSGHEVAKSSMAYSQAILLYEHNEQDLLKSVQTLVSKVSPSDSTFAFIVPAQGLSLLSEGKVKEALIFLEDEEKGLEARKGTSYNLDTTLAQVYLRLFDYKQALKFLRRAIENKPTNVRSYYYSGLAYWMLGDTAQALSQFSVALDNYRSHIPSISLGMVLSVANGGASFDLIQWYKEKLDEIKPENISSVEKGFIGTAYSLYHHFMGNSDDAQTAYAAVPQINNPLLLSLRAQYLLLINDSETSAAMQRKAMQIEPENFFYKLLLAKILAKKKDTADEAIILLDAILAKDPEYDEAKFHKAIAFEKIGKQKQAVQILEELSKKFSFYVRGHLEIARMYQAQKASDKALETLAKVLDGLQSQNAIGIDMANVLLQMGIAYEDQNMDVKALEAYESAIEITESIPEILFRRGKILKQLKMTPAKMKESLEKYISLEPNGKYADEARKILSP